MGSVCLTGCRPGSSYRTRPAPLKPTKQFFKTSHHSYLGRFDTRTKKYRSSNETIPQSCKRLRNSHQLTSLHHFRTCSAVNTCITTLKRNKTEIPVFKNEELLTFHCVLYREFVISNSKSKFQTCIVMTYKIVIDHQRLIAETSSHFKMVSVNAHPAMLAKCINFLPFH